MEFQPELFKYPLENSQGFGAGKFLGVLGLGHLQWDLGTPGWLSPEPKPWGQVTKPRGPAGRAGRLFHGSPTLGMGEFWLGKGIPPRLGIGLVLSQAAALNSPSRLEFQRKAQPRAAGMRSLKIHPGAIPAGIQEAISAKILVSAC